MTTESEAPGINRRDILSLGALSLATAVTPVATVMAQTGEARLRSAAAARAGQKPVRIGIIGAGDTIQANQIPGFRRIPGVEIVAVANRSLESSKRVTDKFGIRKPHADWQDLLADKDIDAVSIGTWPYTHRTMTLAALESGKHVLCQARMANNVAEARDMLDASRRHPKLVTQIVPMSQSYWQDNLLKKLIADRHVGEVLSVSVQRMRVDGFADFDGELTFRHSTEFSGYNALSVGQTYEELVRWGGQAKRVMAMSKVHVPFRRGPDGQRVSIQVPDLVDVLYEQANNAQVHMRISTSAGLSTGNQLWIYGSEGTIHANDERKIFVGKRGDKALAEVANPATAQSRYRVEEEFINAIRGLEEVKLNTFEMGVQNMEFVEAVYRSSKSGQAVHLPL